MRWLTVALCLLTLGIESADAATYYLNKTGSDANSCATAQNEATGKLTWLSAKTCLAAGDTLIIGNGTYAEIMHTQTMAAGTSTNRITVKAQNPLQAIFAAVAPQSRGLVVVTSYVTIQDIVFECANLEPAGSSCASNGSSNAASDVWLLGNVFRNGPGNGFLAGANLRWVVEGNEFADNGQSTGYHLSNGLYLAGPLNWVVRGNYIHGNECAGIRLGNSGTTGIPEDNIVEFNRIDANGPGYGVDACGSDNAGIFVAGVRNKVRYNKITKQGHTGIWLYNFNGVEDANEIYGNTIYDMLVYAIRVESSHTGAIVRNNIALGAGTANLSDAGVGSTVSHNRTTGVVTDCLVSTSDLRLKQGTNPCRDAGIAITGGRPPVGVTDIGAYEQGQVESATVVSTLIEVATSITTGSLTPSTGITGVVVTCIGCTGTPVATTIVKPGSSTVLQVSISGLSSSGSCSISLGSTNLTDGAYIGLVSQGLAQGLNSITGLSVSGTCVNASGGTPPSANLELHYPLNENTGSSVADTSGNSRTGTLSGSPTWVTPVAEGAGVYFANDAVDRRLTSPYGSGITLTSQSVSFCLWAKVDAGTTGKILFGPTNGTDARFYVGVNLNGTWAIGIRASGFLSTGASEFPASANLTHVCVVGDATTDVATLFVNGVKGTSASAVKDFSAGLTLAGNFLAGCGHVAGTSNCGGYSVDRIKVWSTALSDADVLAEYESITPPGSSVSCYGQATHKAELVYTDGTNPIAYGQPAASAYEVVDGGGIALLFQIDCTGLAGTPLALRFFYSTDGLTYDLEIPTSLGANGIALWNQEASGLNNGTATCCISGALSANNGVTLVSTDVSPTITLSQNHSYVIRILLRFSTGMSGQSRWILAKQDNGLDLANGYTIGGARINIVSPRASTFF